MQSSTRTKQFSTETVALLCVFVPSCNFSASIIEYKELIRFIFGNDFHTISVGTELKARNKLLFLLPFLKEIDYDCGRLINMIDSGIHFGINPIDIIGDWSEYWIDKSGPYINIYIPDYQCRIY
jgi:hypothetical protein